MRAFTAFAEFDAFWEHFHPETPYGRDVKDQATLFRTAAELEAVWDETEVALAFIDTLRDNEVAASLVTHHLKRIPRYPADPQDVYGEIEIFQVKKFLHNYHGLYQQLTPEVQAAFGFRWISDGLARLLSVGRQSAESFYLADAYSSELKAVRAEIRHIDGRLADAHAARMAEIERRWGLVFGDREFLLVPWDDMADQMAASSLLLVEPHDDLTCVVRPLRSAEELVASERRVSLRAHEQTCEDAVLARLSHAIRDELRLMSGYREAVQAFDLAFARARLAREHALHRPTLIAESMMEIEGGRFVPCEERCRARATAYQPLDARLDTRANVIFGSNMGGKTIVLKTLAFLQLCAQHGLFVPAARFHTRVFEHFHYVGELPHDGREPGEGQGLSGFGFEIEQLKQAWRDFDAPTLALFDEFARTTNSFEAEALLSAVIDQTAKNPNVLAVFSTHFRGVRRVPGARCYRMRGLDRQRLDLREADDATLADRIRLIDRHMVYCLMPDEDGGAAPIADALAVAAMLGVDPVISARASLFFSERAGGRTGDCSSESVECDDNEAGPAAGADRAGKGAGGANRGTRERVHPQAHHGDGGARHAETSGGRRSG